MKFIHFTMILIALSMVIGIVIAYQFPASFLSVYYLPVFFLALSGIFFWQQKNISTTPLFEIVTLLFFVFIGNANFQLREPSFQKNHYSKIGNETTHRFIHLKIKEVLKPNAFQEKYLAEIVQIDAVKTKGKVLLNLQKDSIHKPIKVDNVLLLSSEIKAIENSLNPHQFNYKKYMQTLGVYYEINSSAKYIVGISEGKPSLKGSAEMFRNYVLKKLQQTPIGQHERAIIEALVLGQRRNISPEVYKEYSAAGAIHILAVSGLHVGIIYVILSWILSPIGYLKKGVFFKSVFIILLLWGFAFLAGLSPSVVRAVTMFSFFSLANMVNRPTNSVNVMFLSLFVLLLINPNWLFHVGFQLSYLAVFFILWVQPLLSKLYKPRYKIDKLFWDIFTVTLAAQLGIAPLSVYYFHQFPGLFFVSNLVILPFLTILLGYGVLVVFLAAINLLPESIALGYHYLIKWLNGFIHWVAGKEAFLFSDISFSLLHLIGFYFLIINGIFWWKSGRKNWIFGVLGSIIFILGTSLYEKGTTPTSFVIFHKPRSTWMAITTKDSLLLFQKDTVNLLDAFPIKSYRTALNKKVGVKKHFPTLFSFKEETFLVMDSLGIYPSKKDMIVILSESPKVHLERMIDSIQPKLIIADGNNYTSYVNRWKKTCEKKQIPFYATREKGAYILN